MSSSSSSFLSTISNLGLGYAIAISLGLLVLLSSLLLASYLCRRRRRLPATPNPTSTPSAAAAGLDAAAIGSYPKFPYSAAKGLGGDPTCSICLCEYREGEMLRMMPDCRHYFHLPCIDAWLGLNASCPVCRTSPMPTPLSTPLSELVPLSQYAADRRRR